MVDGTGTYKGRSHGDHQNLPGTQPERPLSSKVLGNYRDEPLQTSQDRSMDHDRPRGWLVGICRLFRSAILEVKPLGKLEIQLNRGALEGPFQGVLDCDVYLGTVERPISRVNLPFPRVVFLECFRQLLFTSPHRVSFDEASAVETIWGIIVISNQWVEWENSGTNRDPRNTRREGRGGDDSQPQLRSKSRSDLDNFPAEWRVPARIRIRIAHM